jgi:hypothetical protein
MVLGAAALAGTVGFLMGSSRETPGPVAPVQVTSVTTAAPSAPTFASAAASASSAAEPSLLDAARAGDLRALKTLELRAAEARTPDEALAIAAGHATLARLDAARLVADLRRDPKLLSDKSTMAYAYRLALDPEVAPDLLAGLAGLEDPLVADLLYDLAARSEPGSRLHLLSMDLLLGPAVRREAGEALAITLDLRAAVTCERAAALLPRATKSADERAVPHLERFGVEKGCGPKNEDDCFACLRGDAPKKALEEALTAAKDRKLEPPWRAGVQRSK